VNTRQFRQWARNAPEADLDVAIAALGGLALPLGANLAMKRAALLNHVATLRRGDPAPYTPTGWTPPARAGIAGNWPLAVLATAAGLAAIVLLGFLLWNLIDDEFNDNDTVQTDDDATTGLTAEEVRRIAREVAGKGTQTPGGTGTGNGGTTGDPHDAHFARIESLDPAFRSGGWNAWLSAAGIQCDSIRDARQPEEETNSKSGRISVAGLQVVAKNCQVNWPAIVTTDVPSRITTSRETVQYKPDPNNGSVLYTNVTANGEVTIWADGQNWGQFTSKLGFVDGSMPAAAGIKSIDDLKSLGTVIQVLTADGYLAGAQIRLDKEFTAPSGFVIQRQGSEVSSAKAGDTVSIWVPQALRVKQ
jgi:hypothetical protein